MASKKFEELMAQADLAMGRKSSAYTPQQEEEEEQKESTFDKLMAAAYHATGGQGFNTDEAGNVSYQMWRPDQVWKRRPEPETVELPGSGAGAGAAAAMMGVANPKAIKTGRAPVTNEDVQAGQARYATRTSEQERAKQSFWDSVFNMVALGQDVSQQTEAGQFTPDTADQARQMQEYARQAGRFNRRSGELGKAREWEGRDELIRQYNQMENALWADAGSLSPEEYTARANELKALQQKIEQRDIAAGNGARSYTAQDRVGNVLTGTGRNIAAGIVNAAGTVGEAYGQEQMLEQAQNMDQTLLDYRLGEDNAQRVADARAAAQEAHADYQRITDYADRISEHAAEDLQKAKEGLSALGQAGVDIAENLMEMGFDAAVGAATGGGSLGSMFIRVLGQSAMEARQSGATLEQQLAYGLTSAGIEILTEKLADGVAGIYGAGAADDITEELIRKLSDTNLGRSTLRLLIGGLEEGGEEVLSDLLSPLAQAMYKTDENGNRLSVGELYGQLDPSEILHDFLLGAAVGWIGGAGGAVTGQYAQDNAVLNFRDMVEPEARQIVQDPRARMAWEDANDQRLSRFNGRAMRQVLDTQTDESIQKARNYQIIGSALSTIDAPVDAKRALLSGFETGDADAETYAAGAVMAFKMGRSGNFTLQDAIRSTDYSAQLTESQFRQAFELGQLWSGNKTTAATETAQQDASPAAQTVRGLISNPINRAQANKIINDPELRAAYEAETGTTLPTAKSEAARAVMDYSRQEHAPSSAVVGNERLTASLASLGEENAMIAAQAYEEGQDIDTFAAAMNKAAALYAANGKDLDAVVAAARAGKTPNIVGRLTDAQVAVAKQIGARMQAGRTAAAQRAGAQMAAAREANTEGVKRMGSIALATESGDVDGMKYDAVDESKLTRQQKKILEASDLVGRTLGLDITVVSGQGNFGGAYVGNGRIYLNINSGMNLRGYSKAIAAASLGHEIVHSLQDRAEAEYEALKQRVVDSMSAEDLDNLVQEQLRTQPNLTYDGAVDEVVANACQTLLQNSKAMQQLARENMSLAEKIQDVVHEFVDKVKAAFAEVDYHDNLPIFHAVQTVEKSLDQLQEDFDKAILAAKRNADAMAAGNKKTAQEGGAQFMAWSADESFDTACEDMETISDADYLKDRSAHPFVYAMDHTPKIILDNVDGIKDRAFLIRRDALYLAVRADGVQLGNYHNLGADTVKQIPASLENPDAILETDFPNRFIVLTHINTSTGQAMISVEIENMKDYEGNHDYYNIIVTMLDYKQRYLRQQFKNHSAVVKYQNEALGQVNPQLLEWLRSVNPKASEDKVTETGEKVKSDPRVDEGTGAKLQEIGSTATDGVVVSDDMAALMQEEGFSKPVDPVEQLSAQYQVWTTNDWERNYLTSGGDLTVAAQIRDFTNAMIADDAIMGYVPAGHYQKSRFGPLRKNIEYRWTFDMDASCPRTFQFVNYRNALQTIAGRPLTDGEAMNLLYLMRRMNQQIPCTYCYVENKRVMKSKSYLDWFQSRADVMSADTDEEALKKMYSYDAKKGTVGAAAQKVFDEWRADVKAGKAYYPTAQEVWTGWNTAKNTVFNFLDKGLENGVIRFGEGVKKATTQKKMVDAVCKRFGITDKAARREIEGFVAKWRYDVLAGTKHVYDVVNDTSVDTINQDILRLNRLASNYASSVSQARLVDDYIPYTDQLKNVSKADKEYIMGMGGIRKHSSNDFRMDYVQDYFLFYADLAAGGWTGHTYTKSVDYCKVFGRTGDRINLSIAMNTENGKIVENQQEGAAWKDARQLRKAYKDVGVMAMVTDNAQLSFALNNDWIDMCIPFHASGLPKAVWYNLRAWSDYTSVQLESYFNSTEMKERLTAAKVNVKGLNSEEIEALYNETFNVPVIRNQNGQRVKPHFFPNDTTIYGPGGVAQVIPGHHNDAKRYFELCEQYGVHPRFYGTQVTDANGKVIDVTEHPNYVKLIKETSRTDTEQEPIKFNFNEKDENLGMSPFEYAMQRMQEEASIGGYANTAADPMGIVDMFKELYLGKNRDIGWMPADTDESPAAERLRTAMEITQSAYNEMYNADVQTLDTTGYQKVLTEQAGTKARLQTWDDPVVREKAEKAIDFNNAQTETGSQLKTLAGSTIKRGGSLKGKRYPVGKIIGNSLYIHKNYIDTATAVNPELGTLIRNAEQALREEYPDFEYNAIAWRTDDNQIQFQQAPDFDTAREPVVGLQMNVDADGTVTPANRGKPFGQIWHHKWNWVGNDYAGFDVRDSWEWSRQWLNTIVGPSKGGSLNAWNNQLSEYQLPKDGAKFQVIGAEDAAPVAQQYTSEDTSINQNKLPGVFTNKWFTKELVPGGVNIDIGGGKYDNAAEYLKTKFDVTNMVFDPFNRDRKHNSSVLSFITSGKKADTVTCANVLNVINEAAARENVILECAKAVKTEGKAYFLIYEGDKTGNGRTTRTPVRNQDGTIAKDANGKTMYSTSWQEHRDAKSYVDEIRKYFDTVVPHSNLIVAENPKPNLPKAAWQLSTSGETVRFQQWDMTGDDTTKEKRGRETAYARLQSENAILRQTVKELKRLSGKQQTTLANIQKQLRLTMTPETRLSDAAKLARSLLHEYSSTADTNTVAAAIKAVGDYLLNTNTGDITEAELKSRARAAAMEILDNASETMTFDDVELQVNPYDAYMGEASEDLANRIVMDAMEGMLRPTAPTRADRQQARTQALKDRIQQLRNEQKLSQREAASLYQTIYDLSLQLDRQQSRYETLRQGAERRVAQVRAEGSARAAEIKAKERARAEGLLEEQKQHYLDIAKRARERRENTASRSKIRKLIDDLNRRLAKPTEKKYVPQELIRLTVDVLSVIDTDSGRGGEKLAQKLERIRTMYDSYKQDPRYSAVYDEVAAQMLQDMCVKIGDTGLYKMNQDQLESVYSTLKALTHVIDTAVKVRIGTEERNAFEVANEMTQETRQIPKAQKGWLKQHWIPAGLRPDVAFHRFGGFKKNSAWDHVVRMLNDGQLKQTDITMKLSLPFAKLVNNAAAMRDFTGVNFFGHVDQSKLIDIGLKDENGKPILVTHGIAAGIYMDLLNEDNRRHFIRGGKTIPNMKEYYTGRGGFGMGTTRAVGISTELSDLMHQQREAKAEGDISLSEDLQTKIDQLIEDGESYADTVQKNIEKLLTDFDKQWIELTQQLMDKEGKRYLNETTMDVYGIEKATVDHYYPITSDPNYLASEFESVTRDMNLENVGFMKERVQSGNPTLAMDISSVVNNQIQRVAQYSGLMPAIRNFNKIWGKQAFGYSDSLKNAVNDIFGREGGQYVENLIADLTGSRGVGDDSLGLNRLMGRLRGNLAQTSLTLNIRVALAQAASYPTAAAEVGAKALTKAFFRGGRSNRMISRADQELIAKYSPLLYHRMQGYSSVELGDIKNSQRLSSRLWKKARWATGWIQAVDGATVGRLWYAAEYWVQDNMPSLEKGTDEYYQAVARKFNDVVEKTQPNYTTMQRPQILRDPNEMVKMLTMFMTQRLQNFNILYDAAGSYQKARADKANGRNDVTQADVTEARDQLISAVTSQLTQAAVYVGFKLLADAVLRNMKTYRDDDDGELTAESVSMQLLDNYIDAMAGMFIGGSELYSILKAATGQSKWYGLSLNGVDSANDLIDDLVSLANIDRSTDKGREKFDKQLLKTALSLCQALGIPANNAVKIKDALANTITDTANGNFWSFDAGYNVTTAQQKLRDIEALGFTKEEAERFLKEANTNGNGNLSQDEVGSWLIQEIAAGNITEEQANGLWNSQGWKADHDFKWWQEDRAKKAAKAQEKPAEEKPTTTDAGVHGTVTAVTPVNKPAEPQTTDSFEEFRDSVPIWGAARTQAVYDIWEQDLKHSGMSLERFMEILNNANKDGNNSLKQRELGFALLDAVDGGEMTMDQAIAIWDTHGWKKSFRTWSGRLGGPYG